MQLDFLCDNDRARTIGSAQLRFDGCEVEVNAAISWPLVDLVAGGARCVVLALELKHILGRVGYLWPQLRTEQ